MLIGMGKKKTEGATTAPDFIFDATVDDFQTKVVQASLKTPVLVDFWAPWCGPCKQLTPVLEQAVTAAGGKVLLAKINIDDNPELAQALRVQSVPTVYAFFQGQPVTAFAGARPASEIKALIDQLVQMGGQGGEGDVDVAAALAQAGELLAAGQPESAQDLYGLVLAQDPNNAAAYAGSIRALTALDDMEMAESLLEGAPDAVKADPAFAAARAAYDLAKNRPDAALVAGLEARLKADENDHQTRLDLAKARFAGGEREAAIDDLLYIIGRDRAWNEGAARLQLLQFMDAMGPADPATLVARRKLSSLLFS